MRTVVVGAGPAGVAFAVQFTRMGGTCTLYEKKRIGGLINNAWRVENSVFLKEPTGGEEIAKILEEQLAKWKIPVVNSEVLEATYLPDESEFEILTDEYNVRADYLVDATGTVSKKHPLIETLPDEIKKYCFYEIADMPEISGGRIAVIGGGDAAFDYSLNLSSNNSIDIYNRSSRIKSLGLLVELADKNPAISYNDNLELKSAEAGVSAALKLLFDGPGGQYEREYDYLLIAMGREPAVFFVTNHKIAQNNQQLWIIGDKTNGLYRQMTIAAGQGIETAMKIYDKIAPSV